MRVTNKMLSNNFLSDMNVNLNNMKTLQQQMSSGKNFRKPSDDPFNVARSMQMHTAINANSQYNKNINNTINWMDNTDTALNQLGNVFQTIREKMVSAGNAAYGTDERKKIKDQINQTIGQVSQILNYSFDGEYIFGGTKGSSKPVDVTTTPAKIEQTNANGGEANLIGTYTGTLNGTKKYKIKIADATLGAETIQVSDNGGATYGAAISATNGLFNVDNGLKLRLASSTNNKVDDVYSFSLDGNNKLVYCKTNSEDMQANTVESAKVSDTSKWSGGTIDFAINGSIQSIQLNSLETGATLDDVVNEINYNIQSNASLKGKVSAVKTDTGTIEFEATDNDIVNIAGQTGIDDLTSSLGKDIKSSQLDMIKSDRQTEISQGVLVKYNVSASEVINFDKKDSSGNVVEDDIMSLLQRITTHLDGIDGNGVLNSLDATKLISTEDLKDIDSAMGQVLKVRSQVGAMQNRMDSAKDQNEQSNLDMNEILSKTEDIDITEKTMEYATMQTIYLASLQTSGKVLQPTLMDYIR